MMIIYRSIYVRYHAHNPLDSISKVFITDFIDQYNTGITSLIIMLYRACNSFSLPRESTNFLYYRENYSLLSFQYQYRTRYIDSSNRFAGNSSFCTPYKSRGHLSTLLPAVLWIHRTRVDDILSTRVCSMILLYAI